MCFFKCPDCEAEMNQADKASPACPPNVLHSPAEIAAVRTALTALAAEHAARTTHGGLVADMHLMAQKRAEAYRDTFYPEEAMNGYHGA